MFGARISAEGGIPLSTTRTPLRRNPQQATGESNQPLQPRWLSNIYTIEANLPADPLGAPSRNLCGITEGQRDTVNRSGKLPLAPFVEGFSNDRLVLGCEFRHTAG
jgi:hypothetical protein